MIAPRWRKVLRDIQERPGRSLLAVLAMAAGVFEIGALTYKYAVLQPVLTTMYGRTLPAAATLVVDGVSDALIDSVRRVSGVADAEARPVVMARVRVGEDEWVPAMFSVVRDYDHLRTDTFEPNAGAWPPGTGDVLLERTALSVAKVKVGDSVTVRTAGGDEQSLRVAGTVYAAGLPPSWMEHFVPGFVAWNTPLRGEDHGEVAQIRIRVANHPLDEGYIREVADSVKAMLERTGYTVSRVNVPIPGRHPHADQMDAFLYLLSGFGILSFVLSSALVASMVHALLGEQIREVGILKAIGATTRQIAGLYLGQVALLSVASLVIGVPLGLWVGRAYAQFSAQILNADITATPFPWWVVALVVVIGILLPLLFALGPVYRGSRITVQQALAGDVSASWFGSRRLDRWLLKARGLPRPLLLSMRTTLLRRGRLALTVGMLAMGGGAFISALNVSGAWTHELMEDFGRRHYDLAVGLAEPTSIARLETLLAQQPEVEHAEYWAESGPYLIGAGGVAGGTVAMIGQETGSRLLDLPLLAGRWLGPGDSTGVVINRGIVARNPKLAVGGQVALRFEGRTVAYPIVGVVKELTPMPAVYALRPTVLALTGRPATLTRSIRIVTRQHDDAAQQAAAKSLEHAFQENGIEVRGMQRMLDARQGILDHLVIIFSVLTMASVIVVIVGALGLTSTLTLNVVQRTREIGVLSAMGATPSTISRHVWIEGVAIGVLSWALACAVAAPISAVLEAVVGDIFFKAPLDFYLSWSAAAVWLAIVVVVGSVSSFYPAWRAARLTVRQALNTA